MNTRNSSKLAAFAVALTMNSMLFGGMALLFGNQVRQDATSISLASGHAAFPILI